MAVWRSHRFLKKKLLSILGIKLHNSDIWMYKCPVLHIWWWNVTQVHSAVWPDPNLILGPNWFTFPTSQQTAACHQVFFVYFTPACFKHRLSVINICNPQTVAEIITFPKDTEDEKTTLVTGWILVWTDCYSYSYGSTEGSTTTRGKHGI